MSDNDLKKTLEETLKPFVRDNTLTREQFINLTTNEGFFNFLQEPYTQDDLPVTTSLIENAVAHGEAQFQVGLVRYSIDPVAGKIPLGRMLNNKEQKQKIYPVAEATFKLLIQWSHDDVHTIADLQERTSPQPIASASNHNVQRDCDFYPCLI
jgi:hypothetical protein